jgi:hypothetical protein
MVLVIARWGGAIASGIDVATRAYNSGPERHGLFLMVGIIAGGLASFCLLVILFSHILTLKQLLAVTERIEQNQREIPARIARTMEVQSDYSSTRVKGSPSGNSMDLNVGDSVRHASFGEGKVVKLLDGDGNVAVLFSNRDIPIPINVQYLGR